MAGRAERSRADRRTVARWAGFRRPAHASGRIFCRKHPRAFRSGPGRDGGVSDAAAGRRDDRTPEAPLCRLEQPGRPERRSGGGPDSPRWHPYPHRPRRPHRAQSPAGLCLAAGAGAGELARLFRNHRGAHDRLSAGRPRIGAGIAARPIHRIDLVSAGHALLLYAARRPRAPAAGPAARRAPRLRYLRLFPESAQAQRRGPGGVGTHPCRAARRAATPAQPPDALPRRARPPAGAAAALGGIAPGAGYDGRTGAARGLPAGARRCRYHARHLSVPGRDDHVRSAVDGRPHRDDGRRYAAFPPGREPARLRRPRRLDRAPTSTITWRGRSRTPPTSIAWAGCVRRCATRSSPRRFSTHRVSPAISKRHWKTCGTRHGATRPRPGRRQ